ncbi:DEAD/DEAH box helicase family protein [Draconibacterium sp. IB214405]|uniref:DEAD/DEAH box helicase family protein n=1 Tax=Draconibacterium sp. IB214405 TaxID=3097352 RepID=UPI002A15C6B2|nr:DEAD/DEAH box helicase family protein [Draconibacterium sp. IB214405]MDX8339067.1 DEAD/DEAH box helicase family protein [Draconibacterium sp. IB214405]
MNIIKQYSAEYASDVMSVVPLGNVDKTVCGCGLTSVALENDEPMVITVPTIYLALNKARQYPNKRFSGEVLAVWGETDEIDIDLYHCFNKPFKIIVTYDSLPKVKNILNGFKCKLIVDEAHTLLSNTKLKPEVVDEVFKIAEEHKDRVSFISATPTPLEYLPDWVSTLDQVTIQWTNTSKAIPIIAERQYPYKSLQEEFIAPLSQYGTMTLKGRNFRKLIIFVNSINRITDTIKKTGLNKEDCGIICGDSLTNDLKIAGIKRYIDGEMPKFLFITSAGFGGIDIYDSEAMTLVVSNTSRHWQMIDMLTDLQQAISRQRNKDNPNYGTFIYIFNQTLFKKTEEELIAEIDHIRSKITKSIQLYDHAVEKGLQDGFETYPDFEAYTLFKDGRYVINEQAFLADRYFILETRKRYRKGFDIKAQFNCAETIEPNVIEVATYKDLVDYFRANHQNGLIDWGIYSYKTAWISIIERSYKIHGKVWKDISHAKSMIKKIDYGDKQMKEIIYNSFETGSYTRKVAKERLQEVYARLGINKKAQHHHFDELFTKVEHKMVKGERFVEILEK